MNAFRLSASFRFFSSTFRPAACPGDAAYFFRRLPVFFLCAVLLASCSQGDQERPVKPQPVRVGKAELLDVPIYFQGLGTVTPENTVAVKSRVDGQIMELPFTEGQYVEAGTVLARIDPRPFQVQLMQAKGSLASNEAQLKSARLDLARFRKLVKEESVSIQQLQTQEATVGQYEGAVAMDKASIADAELQLTYCTITAPVSGLVGLKKVDLGNMVHASDADGIVVITQMRPMQVVFTLVEKELPEVLEALRASSAPQSIASSAPQSGIAAASAHNAGPSSSAAQSGGASPPAASPAPSGAAAGTGLLVEAWNQAGAELLATGKLMTLDNQIDTATGTIKAKAIFDNADGRLFPNQFVNARLKVKIMKNALVIPTSAVQRGNEGFFVFRVQDGKAQLRPVTTGHTGPQQTVVTSGLEPGDLVVIDGVDRLRDGTEVSFGDQAPKPGNANATGRGGRQGGKE